MKRAALLLAAGAAMLPVYLLASDRTHLESGPRPATIVVDGQHDDWSGALTPLGNNPVSIQVVNDNDAVYLRLVASDAATRMQILRRGLIVWFDEAGGTKKRLGIHYPVNEGGPGGERRSRGGYGRGGRDRDRPDPDAPREDQEPSSRVDILGPGKNDARSLTVDHASGVEVALRVVEGSLLYELKVPLAKTADHPYAIGAAAGATIGLGLETPKPERTAEGGSGGFGGYGGGGRGGGMGGGMRGRGMPRGGGGGGGREFQPPKPLNAWATVTLSRQPAQ